MAFCGKVPAAAWRLLGKAEWPALKKANFSRRLGRGAELAVAFSFLVSAAHPIISPGAQVFRRERRGSCRAVGRLGPLPEAGGRLGGRA